MNIFKKKSIFNSTKKITKVSSSSSDNLFNEINPEKGYEINARYNDLGPKMLS